MGNAALSVRPVKRAEQKSESGAESPLNRPLAMAAIGAGIVLLAVPSLAAALDLTPLARISPSFASGLHAAIGLVSGVVAWVRWLVWAVAVALVALSDPSLG